MKNKVEGRTNKNEEIRQFDTTERDSVTKDSIESPKKEAT